MLRNPDYATPMGLVSHRPGKQSEFEMIQSLIESAKVSDTEIDPFLLSDEGCVDLNGTKDSQ